MSTATMDSPAKDAPSKNEDVAVPPFGIEVDHPRNCDLKIQAIPGCRLRSAIDGTKAARDVKTGEMHVPRDQATTMGDFPRTPGMQLHVNPATCTYLIVDPMAGDEQLQERVIRWMNQHTPFRGKKLKVEGKKEGTLDRHRIKTLCREMLWLVQAGEARFVRGPKPDMQDIDGLPGHYLLNPGATVHNTQPQFEKDFEDWVTNLANIGG